VSKIIDFALPKDVLYIIEKLNSAGHRGDIVGGPVRDFILGKIPDDYDITTDASPEQVKATFSNERIVETGIKHGTVTLVKNGENYEITTYRIDGEYKDSRHPQTVSFTDRIEEDLARRDFTMNSIAYNPKDGITDPYKGSEDIKKRIIRAVGEPERRFTEDALRILRGIRFSARLGFIIEENTKDAMLKKKELLKNVSAERIYVEWKKLLSGDYAYSVLKEYSELIGVFLPELSFDKLPSKEKFSSADYMTRLLSLFYLSGVGEEGYCEAMRRLKTDSVTRNDGALALRYLEGKYLTLGSVGELLLSCGERVSRLVLSLQKLLGMNSGAEELVDRYLASGLPFRLSDLSVNGNDLSSLGALGKEIGTLLFEMLKKVINGELKNEREELLSYAKSRIV
jgi:tRNA nucleotidyltransferase (CCA-adding enzyme)